MSPACCVRSRISPRRSTARARLRPRGSRTEARARFLAAYREAVQRTGLLPSAEGVQERLLDLFELEKVLYELRYELAHRPDWVGVPVAGIAHFLDRVER